MSLEKEFEYYKAHQDELVEKYLNKYVVIKDQIVIGSYDTISEACLESQKTHKPGTFCVMLCTPGPSAYTMSYYGNRVSFKPRAVTA